MTTKISTKDLIRLNELIGIYYGEEINIYVMHGLLVSYLCSASTDNFADLLFNETHQEPVFKMINTPTEDINKEFTHLFLNVFYNNTVEICNNGKFTYQLISTDKFNAKFNYRELLPEQKQHLLDWYMGFFQGFMCIWDHDLIGNYIEYDNPDQDHEIIIERFINSLNVQYLAALQLVKELKPNYTNEDFKYTIKKIKSTVKDMTESEMLPVKFILEHNPQFLQCVSMLIDAVMDAHHFTKNKNPAKTMETVH